MFAKMSNLRNGYFFHFTQRFHSIVQNNSYCIYTQIQRAFQHCTLPNYNMT